MSKSTKTNATVDPIFQGPGRWTFAMQAPRIEHPKIRTVVEGNPYIDPTPRPKISWGGERKPIMGIGYI